MHPYQFAKHAKFECKNLIKVCYYYYIKDSNPNITESVELN